MILLIDNYDSFTYNVKQGIEMLGYECQVFRNDAITVADIERLQPEKIVISPGPGTPDSSGITLDVVRQLGERLPVLGICLGHQAIGQAYGSRVVRAPRPKHGKVSKIFHRQQGMFAGLPSPLTAARYHSLIVERESLADCLEITAETEDGLIMGLRHREFDVEGVQFHPESVATVDGMKLLENFLSRKARPQ